MPTDESMGVSGPSGQQPQDCSSSSRPAGELAPVEKRGWCIKKGKTGKPWNKAHHRCLYFASRANALCYFERSGDASDELGGSRLLGIIDLREVVRIRHSEDSTTPSNAIDIVLRTRTYTIVPQPPTAEEVGEWVRTWARVLRPRAIAPELRMEARLPDEEGEEEEDAPEGSGGRRNSLLGSMATGFASLSEQLRLSLSGGSGGGDGSRTGSADADVLKQGYLQKMPIRSDHRKGLPSVFGEMGKWRRRYFQLRPGMLQWYRDDPGAGGDFLGVLRLTAGAVVELDKNEARLRVRREHASEPCERAMRASSAADGTRLDAATTTHAPPRCALLSAPC